MTSPFDQIARDYGTLWSETAQGRAQREQVWRELDGLFQAGDRVLDLGCGTGDDALHLAERGVEVHGIDASAEMVSVARSRGVDARMLAVKDLAELKDRYAGALANFGVLNCVADLEPLAREFSRLIKPGGKLALCIMPRVSWREFWTFARAGDFRRAIRRWPGHAEWHGMRIYYRSAKNLRGTMARDFRHLRTVGIGGDDHELLLFERRSL